MKNKSSQLTADSALDANGFVTLRRSDGTAHGNTDAQPVATVYTSEDAARIVREINAFPALLAALREMVIAYHGSRANPSEEKDPICRRALEQALSAMKLSGVRAP